MYMITELLSNGSIAQQEADDYKELFESRSTMKVVEAYETIEQKYRDMRRTQRRTSL
jgi:hypothetical protein